MAEQRQTSTAECKREAVRLVPEHPYGGAEAARQLGINPTMRRRGKRACADQANGAFPGTGRLSPEHEALHRLRAEHTRRRMAREIVKKAAACCANASPGGRPFWSRRPSRGPCRCWVRGARSVGVAFMPMCIGTGPFGERGRRRLWWHGERRGRHGPGTAMVAVASRNNATRRGAPAGGTRPAG
jgi:transposase